MRRASTPAVPNCFLRAAVYESSTSSSYTHRRQFSSVLGPFTAKSVGVAGSMTTVATVMSIHGYAFSIPKFPLLPDPNSIFILNSLTANDLKVSANDNDADALDSFNCMLCLIFKSGVKFKHNPAATSLSEQMELRGNMSDIVNLSILINCYSQLIQMVLSVSLSSKIRRMGCELHIIALSTLIQGLCLNGQFQMYFDFISTPTY